MAGRRKPALPERVGDNVPSGSVVVVPQQVWRALLLGFGPGVVDAVLERAKAEGREVKDGAAR